MVKLGQYFVQWPARAALCGLAKPCITGADAQGATITATLDTALCACGSGLRRLRCCDADPAALPAPDAAAMLDAQAAEATKLYNDKKPREAEALALKMLDLAPRQRAALRVLFEIRKSENKAAAAEALARRLAALPAGNAAADAAANLQLAQMLIGQSRHAEAEAAARRALVATPRDPTVHHVIGVVLTETGRVLAGERHYRRATALLGREDGTVLANTAWNLKLQGRLIEAAIAYEQALLLRPDNSRGVGGYAQVVFARGDAASAIKALDLGLERWPADRSLRLLRALADLYTGNAEAVLARLDDPVDALLPAELAARGQALDLLGRPAEALAAFALAKKLQRERYGQSYQPAPLLERASRYKAYFTADKVLAMPRAPAPAGPAPVFLLGFPRSGSSLLEQLLAQVPGFAAGDDFAPVEELLPLVGKLAGATEAADYPEALDATLVGDGLDLPARLRDRYAEARAAAGLAAPGVRFVTDRSPGNVWHLGLIKLLFPDALVIHVLRHPFDVMLSNLGQERKLEANAGVSLTALARHYDLVMSMIRHYRGQLTLRYLPIRYEELVIHPKETLTHILNNLGVDPALAPETAALRHNNLPATPRLPAHMVTRGPIHPRGLNRHRAYEAVAPKLFQEVRPILTPWIEELGYGAAG